MGLFKKKPFIDKAVKDYLVFPKDSLERKISYLVTKDYLDNLKTGVSIEIKEEAKKLAKFGGAGYIKGSIKGRIAYLNRHAKNKEKSTYIKELEKLIKIIEEIDKDILL